MHLLKRDLAKGQAGAVILCDIDNMHPFDHANNHALGDDLLCLVAAVLASRTGWPYAYGRNCHRFGGDEFLIRLPGKDAQTAAVPAPAASSAIPAVAPATTESRTATIEPIRENDRKTVHVLFSTGPVIRDDA
jgi:GGDEF domain-containing protein